MFFVRYLPGVDLRDRKHEHTAGRFDTWVEAFDALEATPAANLLEVVER